MRLSLLPRPTTARRDPVASLAERLRAADAERLQRYAACLRFYNGHHWDHLGGTDTAPRGRPRLTLNYARAIADKGISYLLGRGVNFSVPEDARAEALLYRVYDDNALAAADLHGATNGAVLGDTVFKVTWDPRESAIRVANVDPLAFFADWPADGSTARGPRRVYLVYPLAADDAEATLAVRPTGAVATVVERWSPERFALLVDGRVARSGPNPYGGLVPFVHIPNLQPPNAVWGVSDLRDVMPLNREINARLSDQSESIRYHADPPVIFRGVTEHSDLAVGAGTVWDVPADADVHLLEWKGQPPTVQAHVELLFRALYEVAETPRTSFGDSGRLLSGVALEMELRPLIMRTLRKRVFWEVGLRRRNALILALARQFGLLPGSQPDLPSTRILWPPLVPRDDAAEVQQNIALVQAGLRSRLTALDALGAESPEAELRRIEAEGAGLGSPGRGGEAGGRDLQPPRARTRTPRSDTREGSAP